MVLNLTILVNLKRLFSGTLACTILNGSTLNRGRAQCRDCGSLLRVSSVSIANSRSSL